ncbi:MAG: amino acid decarboxylase [Eubacteriales bacterium]|nr:amino acid decarboxylase [Eubacteriales bacterium]
MNTPIADFVRAYADSDTSRFHMPGHKGVPFLGPEPLDITEIHGADVLYDANGIIRESEDNASSLFRTAHTFYSAEGSSLSIRAMLALVCDRSDGQRPLILAARNVHRAFVYASAWLDFDTMWLYPSRSAHLCACPLSPEDVRCALLSADRKPAAVYLTSPDYLGQTADIEGISIICSEYGVPLLVDNAHGAYLAFLSPSRHPIALGADMCCDSAHKTLPVLTGGSYLHVSPHAEKRFTENARAMLAAFASTSPSYLILASLDLCNRYLAGTYREKLADCVRKTEALKASLSHLNFEPEDSEPLKVVINGKKHGLSGRALAKYLRREKVEPEFYDDEFLVLMVSAETRDLDFRRVVAAFERAAESRCDLPQVAEETHRLVPTAKVMTAREALLAPRENVAAKEAAGRICAVPSISCPPAVPIVIGGEIIPAEALSLFEAYGIETVSVVKKR